MSLEQKIEALTAAVEALTVAMKAGGAASSSADKPTGTKTTKTTKAEYVPQHSKEEMQAAMAEVKDKLGVAKAKEIRGEVGKADKLADITDPKVIDAVYEAAKAALEAAEEEDV